MDMLKDKFQLLKGGEILQYKSSILIGLNRMANYPNTVCIDCLVEACNDTKKHENHRPKWNTIYTVYVVTCEVCGEEKECTESRDAGYPTFTYLQERIIQRKRAKKIKRIKDAINR